jgi:hypothetical protein
MSIRFSWRRAGSARGFLAVLAVLALAGVGYRVYTPRVVTTSISIRQDSLLAGRYTLGQVLGAGAQFFTTPYMPEDGMGEGPNGPRSAQRAALYPHHPLPFLRLNGIDSQSCYECHNTIGNYGQTGLDGGPQTRKPGSVGGSAGFASVLFQNPGFPDSVTHFLRNPPHVFGTGYSQRLAWEMTHELLLAALADTIAALLNPGRPQTIALRAKGLSFGQLTVTYNPASNPKFTTDTTGITGVHHDLIVRPLQNKAIASSVRHFVESALDFHFSMQSVEKAGYDTDCDGDGLFNEMGVSVTARGGGRPGASVTAQQSLGNVAALSAFVAMTRPPQQIVPRGMEATVARGRQLFSQVQCSSCHSPEQVIEEPVLTIATVSPDSLPSMCPTEAKAIPQLGANSFDTRAEHPVARALYAELGMDVRGDFARRVASLDHGLPRLLRRRITPAQVLAVLRAALAGGQPSALPPGYHVNLVSPDTSGMSAYLRSYILPRLAATNGTVSVPLFSDLRLHDMGEGLSDVSKQETDVTGVFTPARKFLTRPLWGVGDTPPYLHDGRARDLEEAIAMHASPGSEANAAVAAFNGLSAADQQAVISFLLSLRLPVQSIYTHTGQ